MKLGWEYNAGRMSW